jgi:hypothetical protein
VGVVPEKDRRHLEGRGLVVGTKFRPGGFQGFAPERSQRGLVGRLLGVAEAFGPDGARLQREVARRKGDVTGQVAAVTAFLAARMPEPDPAFALVATACTSRPSASPTARTRTRAWRSTWGTSTCRTSPTTSARAWA